MISRQATIRSRYASRPICWAVVAMMVCAALPLPTSLFSEGSSSDGATGRGASTGFKKEPTPFPCQHRPCGCRTAEQCWRRCCCFSNTEKLAWAKRHHVTPPSYVEEAAARESQVTRTPPKACCGAAIVTPPNDVCCRSHLLTSCDRCGTTVSCGECQHRAALKNRLWWRELATFLAAPFHGLSLPRREAPPRDESPVQMGLFAQECQGNPWGWIVLATAVSAGSIGHAPHAAVACERPALVSETAVSRDHQPAVPPPRAAAPVA